MHSVSLYHAAPFPSISCLFLFCFCSTLWEIASPVVHLFHYQGRLQPSSCGLPQTGGGGKPLVFCLPGLPKSERSTNLARLGSFILAAGPLPTPPRSQRCAAPGPAPPTVAIVSTGEVQRWCCHTGTSIRVFFGQFWSTLMASGFGPYRQRGSPPAPPSAMDNSDQRRNELTDLGQAKWSSLVTYKKRWMYPPCSLPLGYTKNHLILLRILI